MGLIICGLIFAVIFAGSFSQDIFKPEIEFCRSCHVGDKPLHDDIYKTQTERNPVTLGGRHYLDEKISCVECHRGIKFREKTALFFIKSFNVFKYLSGCYEEPSNLSYPMADDNCIRCHKADREINVDGFHGRNAHEGISKVICIECHPVHKKVKKPGKTFLLKEKVLAVCSGCHPGLNNEVKGILKKI